MRHDEVPKTKFIFQKAACAEYIRIGYNDHFVLPKKEIGRMHLLCKERKKKERTKKKYRGG
jgi:hypothetical protein